MAPEAAGGRVLRFPLERRLAAIDAEAAAQEASEGLAPWSRITAPQGFLLGAGAPAHAGVDWKPPTTGDGNCCNYVFDATFFGVRLRPQ